MRTVMKPSGLLIAAISFIAAGCSTVPSSNQGRIALEEDVKATVSKARAIDPSINRFFNESAGYAVFPNVGKGGAVLGGAYGQGMLFENHQFTSYCSLTQGTIGLQLGGQTYSEIIFFQTPEKLQDFKDEQFALAAQASAVALQAGAAANVNYSGGVAVFTMGHGGLMAEASIGGQKFDVVSRDDASYATDYRTADGSKSDWTKNPGTVTAGNGYQGVYGYAGNDDVDSYWKHDSEYNRGYNLNQGRSISGEITAIDEFSPHKDARKGRQLTIRDDAGQTYVVHLGPSNWMTRQDDRVKLRVGDKVTVTGSAARVSDNDVILAQRITLSDGTMLDIRDAQGRGRWDLETERERQLRNSDPNRNNNDPNFDGSRSNVPNP